MGLAHRVQSETPLLFSDDPAVELERLEGPMIRKRGKRTVRRDVKDLRRSGCAREALAGFGKEVEFFGFTRGGFSFIDLIAAAMEYTGPCFLLVSTWTAASGDANKVSAFLEAGRLTGTRWLVDRSFQRRRPAIAQQLRTQFGASSIRVGANHAKFAVLINDEAGWRVVIRTSMNLNMNARFEDFTISHDPELAGFLVGVFREIWKKADPELERLYGRA